MAAMFYTKSRRIKEYCIEHAHIIYTKLENNLDWVSEEKISKMSALKNYVVCSIGTKLNTSAEDLLYIIPPKFGSK